MNMLFEVLAKLAGLLYFFRALFFMTQVASEKSPALSHALIGAIIISFVLSLILIFKTRWLIRFFELSQSSSQELISESALLKSGIVLIGLFHFIERLSHIVYFLIGMITLHTISGDPKLKQIFVSDFVPALVSLFCIFYPGTLIKLIKKVDYKAS